MSMKIKNLKVLNFSGIESIEMEFDGKVTHLVGANGSGKTRVLTSIWAGLNGIAQNDRGGNLVGDRFRFIGPSKPSSDIYVTIVDEENGAEIEVRNHITKQSNQITFQAPDGYPLSEDWLKNLLSVAFLSEKHFTALTPKEQALLLGIDTASFDEKIGALKTEFTQINRDLRNLGEVAPVEKAEKVDLDGLLKLRDHVEAINVNNAKKRERIKFVEDIVHQSKGEIEDLKKQIESLEEKVSKGEDYLKRVSKPADDLPLSEISAKISNVSKTNEEAVRYERYLEDKAKKDKIKKNLDKNTEAQEKIKKDRLKYIREFDFGFDGLGVDEDGGLVLAGRPISEPYFSKGEREMIVARLCVSQNPKLKFRFVDEFGTLDDDNQKILLEQLYAEGFQVMTSDVRIGGSEENTIRLKDGKIDKGPEKEKKEKLV